MQTGKKTAIPTMGHVFEQQINFQKQVIMKHAGFDPEEPVVPIDNPTLFQYHMTAMVEELGEVLKADKRWKTHRNVDFDPANKLDELADCYITLFNLTMFSGIDYDQMVQSISNKINRNIHRLIVLDS